MARPTMSSTRDVCFAILHVAQFILAVTVIGLYSTDLSHAQSKKNKKMHVDGKWVYAVVVASLSGLTSLLYLIPFILRFAIVPIWSFILFVLWIALFGLFGNLYINMDAKGNGDVQRMKNAVWVDLANALLWFIGASLTAAYWWFHRQRETRFTGRAKL
ncbi:hypothetical protein F4861DRAFT_526120 [Xylaria intraflava]|nr:hypothetical protein F4861DRAFT_526120 [Xylaria intraflava]